MDGNLTKVDNHRCSGRPQHKLSAWAGTPFSGSSLSARHAYNLCVGYSARLTPTQAAVDKGVERSTASTYWKWFRRAEAFCGLELRADTVFEGSPDRPVEVEIDEALLKRVRYFHPDGTLDCTVHYFKSDMFPG